LFSSLPTWTSESFTPNSRRISSRMIFRVHSPKSNSSCRGSLPVIIAYSFDNCVGLKREAGPGVFFVSRATGPPWSYFCCHRNSIARETLNILATAAASFPSLRN